MRKLRFLTVAAALLWVPSLWGASCSCSDDEADGTTTSAGGSGGLGAGGTAGSGANILPDAGCQVGDPCGDGGVCAGDGTCCEVADLLCGDQCCGAGQVCSFQACQTPGDDCVDATDCAADEYCEYGLGEGGAGGQGGGGGLGGQCSGGVRLPTGKCLPKPPQCPPDTEPGDPPTCVAECEYHPPLGQFEPTVKFSWGDPANPTHNVMMAPVVIQLDDDNCDATIDEKDLPDIVFFTFDNGDYNNNNGNSATLHAISIVDGAVVDKWSTKTSGDYPGRSIAAGDLDLASPGSEIAVCTTDNRVRVYGSNGVVKWTSQPTGGTCFMPSIADMDQDGQAEIVVNAQILDGLTGAPKVAAFNPPNNEHVVVSDVDGDGVLDVVTPTKAYDASGNLIVATGLVGTHAAVGDLDNDGIVEIASVNTPNHTLSIWRVNPAAPGGFEVIRTGLDINSTISPNPCCLANPASAGCSSGGGPPTIADFDGDGFPDVGLAGGIGYVVFDGQSLTTPAIADVDTVLWLTQTQDCSSAQTGSSVFDFDGDGAAEVVYADEVTLHIYSGVDGQELFQTCNTNGTLWEYPLVADVDNDGHADIVVGSNSYSSFNCSGVKTTGIRIFGDTEGKWVRTRRIWNQHPYHVTNVEEDGRIPMVETPNHTVPGLNNFRQNVQPLGEFAAPDLIVSVAPQCNAEYGLLATVRNIGQASVPPGVLVGFYSGLPATGTKLGEAATTQPLYSLGAETVFLPLPSTPAGPVYAVVDDDPAPQAWHECKTDNNVSDGADPACDGPK